MIFPNNTISVKRLATDQYGKDSYGTAFLTDLPAYIEPMQAELAPMWNGNNAYQVYRIFVDLCDIKIKDRIIDADSREYAVEGVNIYKNGEIPSHLEIVANSKFS